MIRDSSRWRSCSGRSPPRRDTVRPCRSGRRREGGRSTPRGASTSLRLAKQAPCCRREEGVGCPSGRSRPPGSRRLFFRAERLLLAHADRLRGVHDLERARGPVLASSRARGSGPTRDTATRARASRARRRPPPPRARGRAEASTGHPGCALLGLLGPAAPPCPCSTRSAGRPMGHLRSWQFGHTLRPGLEVVVGPAAVAAGLRVTALGLASGAPTDVSCR